MLPKKVLFLLSAVFLLLLFTASVHAGSPVDHPGDFITLPVLDGTKADYTCAFSFDAPITGQDVPFTVTGETPTKVMLGFKPASESVVQCIYSLLNTTDFHYTFYYPGKYYAYAFNSSGATIGYTSFQVTGTDYMQAAIKQLSNACPYSDDYGKSLWIHDYLARNTFYDSTTVHHDPAVLLLQGYGVCQSYVYAYQYLMQALGVDCAVLSSQNHGWNKLTINGTPVLTDVTWDTPAYGAPGSTSPAGYCYHIYFNISQDIMGYQHAGIYANDCVSMAESYYVHEGWAMRWIENVKADIISGLNTGADSFAITVNIKDPDIAHDYLNRQDVLAASIAEMLQGYTIDTEDGASYTITAAHEPNTYAYFSSVIHISVLSATPVLRIPDNVGSIEAEAFAGTSVYKVIIPTGCISIGSRAFADNTYLEDVSIPMSVISIADDAFSGCSNAVLRVVQGSYAMAWAQAHQFAYVIK